jgi:hypothetical protein
VSDESVVRNQTTHEDARRRHSHSHRSQVHPRIGNVVGGLGPVVAEVVRDRLVERRRERDPAHHCQRLVPLDGVIGTGR